MTTNFSNVQKDDLVYFRAGADYSRTHEQPYPVKRVHKHTFTVDFPNHDGTTSTRKFSKIDGREETSARFGGAVYTADTVHEALERDRRHDAEKERNRKAGEVRALLERISGSTRWLPAEKLDAIAAALDALDLYERTP